MRAIPLVPALWPKLRSAGFAGPWLISPALRVNLGVQNVTSSLGDAFSREFMAVRLPVTRSLIAEVCQLPHDHVSVRFHTRFGPAFQIEALQLNEACRWVNRNGTARIIFRFEIEFFVQKAILQVWGLL